MTTRAHLHYLSYVLRHKWFVLVAGLKVRAPLWRLLIHDWSKFTPAEWSAYVRYFHSRCERCNQPWRECPEAEGHRERLQPPFDRAWLHHQHANPHHWQHWLLREDSPRTRYVIQSHDGGYTGNHIVRGEDASRHPRVELDIPTANINLDANSARYQLAAQLIRDANQAPKVLPMPEHFMREMVADWMGAGRAITGRWEVAEWYAKNREKIQLAPETRELVERLIASIHSAPAATSEGNHD